MIICLLWFPKLSFKNCERNMNTLYIIHKQYCSYFTGYKGKVPPSKALPSNSADFFKILPRIGTFDANL